MQYTRSRSGYMYKNIKVQLEFRCLGKSSADIGASVWQHKNNFFYFTYRANISAVFFFNFQVREQNEPEKIFIETRWCVVYSRTAEVCWKHKSNLCTK